MSVIGSNIIAGASGVVVETGYQIARSLRLNSADTTYLSRTPGSNGNRQKWTLSAWVKRSAAGFAMIYGTTYGAVNSEGVRFNSDDTIFIYADDGNAVSLVTSQVFRDYSAYYHIVVAVDTTQATASNRVKLYINGVQVTAFSTATYPAQNFLFNTNSISPQNIGRNPVAGNQYINGYMTEMYMIDGQQLDPTSFGQTDSATGVWMPKQVTGMTYGTNGFYLNFSDNSGVTATTLGKDSSGNGNNWTPNNFSVTAGTGNDSLVDTPTNYGTDTGVGGEVRGNYCTLNPLDNGGNTLTDGNLSGNKGGGWSSTRATMACPTTGKWYWEAVITAGGNNMTVGIATNAAALSGDIIGRDAYGWGYVSGNGQKWTNGSGASYGATWTAGDIIGIAFDADAGTLTFYKNNTSQGTAFSSLTSGPYFPGVSFESTTGYVNFGQRPFAYTAPSGFKALCTQNLPTPAIGASASTLASKNFGIVNWNGDNTTSRTISGAGFEPDFAWLKRKNSAGDHGLMDRVRGATARLISNSTAAEDTTYGLSAFASDGITTNSANTAYNATGDTHVGWLWKAGGAGVSNTAGTITSTVSANTTAGIAVVTYTGTGANATVGHGLGVAPKMIIIKDRTSGSRTVSQWPVYHASVGNTKALYLNATDAAYTDSTCWQNTTPTSSVFSIGTWGGLNYSGDAFVAYCFAEVAGFSKFGSYTGNGSTDGPFIFTGFRPRFIFFKRTDSTGHWNIFDTARNTYNATDLALYPSLSNAETSQGTTGNLNDILSNGFKLRGTGVDANASGATYIFMAFAEAPFNYSRAR